MSLAMSERMTMKSKTRKLLVAAALTTSGLATGNCIHVPGSAGSANHGDTQMRPRDGGSGGAGGAPPDAAPDDADAAPDGTSADGGEKS